MTGEIKRGDDEDLEITAAQGLAEAYSSFPDRRQAYSAQNCEFRVIRGNDSDRVDEDERIWRNASELW